MSDVDEEMDEARTPPSPRSTHSTRSGSHFSSLFSSRASSLNGDYTPSQQRQRRSAHGVHLALPPRANPDSDWEDEPGEDESQSRHQVDFVVVPGMYHTRDSYFETFGWVYDYAGPYKHRVLTYEYDGNNLFTGLHYRDTIRQPALRLLHGLSALREHQQRRPICFVSCDFGGMVVKEALALASLDPARWADIFGMARILFFHNCPHRCRSVDDMRKRLASLHFVDHQAGRMSDDRARVPDTYRMAQTVLDVNASFIESKVLLHAYPVSILPAFRPTGEKDGEGLGGYCGFFDLPLETRIVQPDRGTRRILDTVDKLVTQFQIEYGDEELAEERVLLSLASPLFPFEQSYDQIPSRTVGRDDGCSLRRWLDHRGPNILYIHGTGAVQHASEEVYEALNSHDWQHQMAVLYFSFNRSDPRRNSVLNMASTFLAQMVCLFPQDREAHNISLSNIMSLHTWTEADTLRWLARCTHRAGFRDAVLILNHLDECPAESRERLFARFKAMARYSEWPLKMVVTSREPGALLPELGDAPFTELLANVQMDPFSCKESIMPKGYMPPLDLPLDPLALVYEQDWNTLSGIDPVARSLLCRQILADSAWPAERYLEGILGYDPSQMPKGAWDDQSLARLLDRLLRRIPSDLPVRSILRWTMHANWPLSLDQLAVIVGMPPRYIPHPSDEPVAALSSTLDTWFAGFMHIAPDGSVVVADRWRDVMSKQKAESGQVFMWEEVADTAHYDIVRFLLHHLTRPGLSDVVDDLCYVSQTYGACVSVNRGNLHTYALQAWPIPFLELTSVQRKELAGLFADAEVQRNMARGYWALENRITRTTEPQSLYPVLAGYGILDAVDPRDADDVSLALVWAASKGRQSAVESLLREHEFDEPALRSALVCAAGSGDEQTFTAIARYSMSLMRHTGDPEGSWISTIFIRAVSLGLVPLAEEVLEFVDHPSFVEKVGFTELVDLAIQGGHPNMVKFLLSHTPNADATHTSNGLLHSMVLEGFTPDEIIKFAKPLIRQGLLDVNAMDSIGRTALYLASQRGHHGMVKALLDMEADPNLTLPTPRLWSPLGIAAACGYTRCVRHLLKRGADANLAASSNGTALSFAAVKGQVDICRLMLEEAAADPNSPLISPSIIILILGQNPGPDDEVRLKTIELLLDHGADADRVDSDGNPLLSRVLKYDLAGEVCEQLLDHGADINQCDAEGWTPLHHAVLEDLNIIAHLLVLRGANINCVANKGSPVHLAVHVNNVDMLDMLLQSGADANLVRGHGVTPLMDAADVGKEEALELLLECGVADAAVDAAGEGYHGWTALFFAIRYGSVRSVQILANAGVNLQHVANGMPALHFAALNSSPKLGVLLENVGRVDINQRDDKGRTLLHLRKLPYSTFKSLVRLGVDLDATDYRGRTPLAALQSFGDRVSDKKARYILKYIARRDEA
ncbi:ankyrin repeat-containing domain protein [Podospora aff. communis PSN243]|uniref:Ankyrin repeat-containing domain protein n=1 Tax=Podospora aff. communis PSN243 TaxID=3040156 RepID=A0AAV9G9Y8_9PEZI|nr:ankyrin repeat-containing domain protein [Podospora aff. communis PSN243]